MSAEDIMRASRPSHDWAAADAMSEADVHAAAVADPNAQPLSDEQWSRAKKVPRVKSIRTALQLSPEAFADQFQIPLDLVQAWEAGTSQPDAAATAYLRVIAKAPDVVRAALAPIDRPIAAE